jgi:hypothetical protein
MWGQSDIAIANAMYGWLFPDDKAAGGAGAVQAGLKQNGGADAGGAHKGSGRAHSPRAKKQKKD